jgi:undecaprenyl-diphosphatase
LPIEQLIILSIIQGVTEFLPVSSSGHLVLAPIVFNWQDQGLLIDIATHVGSLFAVIIYFRRDVGGVIGGGFQLLSGRRTQESTLFVYLALGTVPIVIVGGLLLLFGMTSLFRSAEVIGWSTLLLGVVLYVADTGNMTLRRAEHMTLTDALIIGAAQMLSVIPGASRSGVTMTAARFLGFERTEAARFSMLLSIPTIAAAGALAGFELYRNDNAQITTDALIAGGLAFLSALVSIWGLMALLERMSFTPFVIYRMLLGALILGWTYFG